MATMEMRGFRRQVLGKLREYEGHVKRLEGQLMILRGRAERATGEAPEKLGKLLTEVVVQSGQPITLGGSGGSDEVLRQFLLGYERVNRTGQVSIILTGETP